MDFREHVTGEVRRIVLPRGWVDRALEGYPEQVEDNDKQPSHYPADSADDYGKEVEGYLVGQEQVGQEQEDQPDDGVSYKPTYEPHALGHALNA
jgi:hypothetical protein